MNTDPDLPKAAKYWPDHAVYIFLERIAIMREGNNISDEKQTPLAIIRIATECAEKEIKP